MRLGAAAREALRETVHKALAGPCVVRVPARNRAIAYRIFQAATPHIEELGAVAQPHMLAWQLPNGSRIQVTHGQNAEV